MCILCLGVRVMRSLPQYILLKISTGKNELSLKYSIEVFSIYICFDRGSSFILIYIVPFWYLKVKAAASLYL